MTSSSDGAKRARDGASESRAEQSDRSSGSSWAAVRIGRRCPARATRSTSSASRARCASSRRTACPTRCSTTPSRRRSAGLRRSSPAPAAPRICPGMTAAKTLLPVIGVPVQSARWRARFAALDRADAARRAGRDDGDRRRRERGALCRAHPRAARCGRRRASRAPTSRGCTTPRPRARSIENRSRRSASSAADSSAACSRSTPSAWATRHHARAAGSLAVRSGRRRADRRRLRRPARDRRTRPPQRRRHLRVREHRIAFGASPRDRSAIRVTPVEQRAARHAGPAPRKTFVRDAGIRDDASSRALARPERSRSGRGKRSAFRQCSKPFAAATTARASGRRCRSTKRSAALAAASGAELIFERRSRSNAS